MSLQGAHGEAGTGFAQYVLLPGERAPAYCPGFSFLLFLFFFKDI